MVKKVTAKFKKYILVILLGTVLVLSMSIGTIRKDRLLINENKKNENITVAVVFTRPGVGDKSFNDLTYDGLIEAQQTLGIEFDYSEPKQNEDYEESIRNYAKEKKYDLIIAVGPEQEEAVKNISDEFPNQKFTIIDSKLEKENVSSMYTKWEEQTFLNGVIAGLLLKEKGTGNKTGVILGKDLKHLKEGAIGFEAGVRYVNPQAEVSVAIVDDFSNPAKAREIAMLMYNKGVDYIQHLAGESGLGVFSAAKELNKYAFGVDANQNLFEPNNIVTTTVRNINELIYKEIKYIRDGVWQDGVHVLGFKENVILIEREGSNVNVSNEILDIVKVIKSNIINGQLVIPNTKEALEEWLKLNKY